MAEIVSQHKKSQKLQIRYHLTCKYIKVAQSSFLTFLKLIL